MSVSRRDSLPPLSVGRVISSGKTQVSLLPVAEGVPTKPSESPPAMVSEAPAPTAVVVSTSPLVDAEHVSRPDTSERSILALTTRASCAKPAADRGSVIFASSSVVKSSVSVRPVPLTDT